MINENISEDDLLREYYDQEIIYTEDNTASLNEFNQVLSVKEIEEIINTESKTYDFIIKLLKKNNIKFTEKDGIRMIAS